MLHSVDDVTAFVDGQDKGIGSLGINGHQLHWVGSSSHQELVVDINRIRNYGIDPSSKLNDPLKTLTLICDSITQENVGKTVVEYNFYDEYSLTRIAKKLIELVDIDPTLPMHSVNDHLNFPSIIENQRNLRTSVLKTHVTCIRLVGNMLFAGVGDVLQVFSNDDAKKTWAHVLSRKIFQGQNIYGIEVHKESATSTCLHLIVFGGKLVSYLLCTFVPGRSRVRLIYSFAAQDWILDCIWMEDFHQIALLTANNSLLRYNLLIYEPALLSVSYCTERCILYSGKLLGSTWDGITVLAGTVFSTIIIWSNAGANVQKAVVHQLKGHKGVIFSINFCDETHQISSTSDDRTVRVWDVEFNDHSNDWLKCSISLKFSLYGHSARVWKSSFISKGHIVSVGEDSRICLWKDDGTLDNRWDGHQNGEIWSLDVSDSLQLIATGGSDGGITLWPIGRAPLPYILPFEEMSSKIVPRCVGFSYSGLPFLVSCDGDVLLYQEEAWKVCFTDSKFSGYCLHSVSPSRTLLALASITGCVSIFRFNSSSIEKLVDFSVCEGRIYSLIWLSESSLVICEPIGNFAIWSFNLSSFSIEKVFEFVLPHSKERWFTSCAADEKYVVCGDRFGSLFLYLKIGGCKDPIFSVKKIHGNVGVTSVKMIRGKILSTGRDGKYREFVIENDQLILLRCYKLKLEWAAAVFDTPALQRILICFHEVYFIIWSLEERRPILKIDCGGGHRSWDCLVDSKTNNISITYIKGKSVYYCSIPSRDVLYHTVLPGCHPKAINAAVIVPAGTEQTYYGKNNANKCENQLLLLGGEDTTIRLVSLGSQSQTQLNVLQSHLSSVRTLVCHRSNFENSVYIVSGGGRGQFILWKVFQSIDQLEIVELASYFVMYPSNKNRSDNVSINDGAEMRIMDLQVCQRSGGTLILTAAGSDGILRIFTYDIASKIIHHFKDIDCGHCLLKTLIFEWEASSFLVNGSTSGLLEFHHFLDDRGQSEVNSYSVSNSGINSCDYQLVGSKLVISSGGDDARVNMVVFIRIDRKWEMEHHWRNESAHHCQISGLKMDESWLFTAGLDQSLSIFSWKLSELELQASLFTRLTLCIPDIHGTLVWRKSENSYCVFVYGLGTQLLEFSCDV